jgi:hypothetical protein
MTSAALDKLIDKEDPTNLFMLHEELAEGSFGVVYSVRIGVLVALQFGCQPNIVELCLCLFELCYYF